ncbi:MAG: ZIP family metal transporter [Candidatus Aenigmarchaeota archaeon]|nr:ZIP family metal transporter [Candidatus Aenigmarchaeota archaeon]
MDALTVIALSFAAGVATVLGGLLYDIVRIDRRLLQWALSSSTGLVLSIVFLGLMPAAVQLGGNGYTAMGFVLGGIVFMITGTLFPHTYLYEKYEDKLYSILKTGTLVLAGVVLYNIAAGLAIGAGLAHSASAGFAIAAAVALQNIPRGVAIKSPMSQTGIDRRSILGMMLLAGVVCLFSAALMFLAVNGSADVILASGLAFSSGAFSFIFVDQMIPLLKSGRRPHELAISLFVGLFLGILILGI